MSSQSSFVDRIRPLLGSRSRGEQLFLAALLESGAAERYRQWADSVQDIDFAVGLRECAAREDRIASSIRSHFAAELAQPSDFAALMGAVQKEVVALFGGRSLEEQFAIQAAAERGGEQLWKELAAAEPDPASKQVLLECAELEAESAAYLESR